MTRNVDLRGHPGLKRDECISIHRYYEPTKFHQNRKGSGQLVIDLTWNDPEAGCLSGRSERSSRDILRPLRLILSGQFFNGMPWFLAPNAGDIVRQTCLVFDHQRKLKQVMAVS